MNIFNVLYDWDYDDKTDIVTPTENVDLITVPDSIADPDRLDDLLQEFNNYVAANKQLYTRNIDDKEVIAVQTQDFLDFLNERYLKDGEIAKILEEDVPYNPEFPMLLF